MPRTWISGAPSSVRASSTRPSTTFDARSSSGPSLGRRPSTTRVHAQAGGGRARGLAEARQKDPQHWVLRRNLEALAKGDLSSLVAGHGFAPQARRAAGFARPAGRSLRPLGSPGCPPRPACRQLAEKTPRGHGLSEATRRGCALLGDHAVIVASGRRAGAVEVAGNDVVHVVAVRDGFVPACRSVLVGLVM